MTRRTDPTSTIPPQPNVVGLAAGLPVRFWTLLALTGIGTGFGCAALMLLLHAVQHVAWSHHAGNFLDGVQRSGPIRRVLVVLTAGEDFPPLETTTAADLVHPVAAAGGPPLKPPEPRGRA